MALPATMPTSGFHEPTLIEQALTGDALTAVFQPVIRVDTGQVVAYEGLIRSLLPQFKLAPPDLLDLARALGRLGPFELAAARCVATHFAASGLPGRLLVNLSSYAIVQEGVR